MDLSNIKNIIFDFGCVLIDLDKQRCVEAFQEIGAAEIAKYVDEQRSEDLFHDLELGKITAEEFCDEARCRIGKDVSNEDIFGAWNALLLAYRLVAFKKSWRCVSAIGFSCSRTRMSSIGRHR